MRATEQTLSPSEAVSVAYERIGNDGRQGIWIELVDRDVAVADAERIETAIASGYDRPLAGKTFAVKNNIDVRGIRTTAECPTYGAVASENAPVVQSLVDAGAVVIGTTNLDQFATGLVGTRSPYGVCPNAHWPGLISGGSSSGSAVAVAAGLVDLALGTDTAGSGRVPAAANGIIGFKPTREGGSTRGIVPACPSFDCVSLFARDPRLARIVFEIAGQARPAETVRPLPLRLAIPKGDALTFDGDERARGRFEVARTALASDLGATITDVDLTPFLETGKLLYEGAFVNERYEAVGAFIDDHPGDVDPIVYSIIHAARDVSSARIARDFAELERQRLVTAALWSRADVLVVPTVPRLPTAEEVQQDPIAVNTMLGTYTNFVNLLDLCAVSLPIGESSIDGPPASVMLIAPPGRDELLLDIVETVFQPAAR